MSSIQKVMRKAGLTVSHQISYSHSRSFISQNGISDYLKYNVWSGKMALSWNKYKYIHATLTAAYNVNWKGHDSFSDASNVLKNGYYTLRTDIFPTSKMQVYVDFSHTVFELSQGEFSQNCFLNVGAKYLLLKNISCSVNAINLFDRQKYEESRYIGANYSFFYTPLRGREVMFSLNVKF